MKKFLASASAAFLIVAGAVTFGTSAANATTDVCVPSEAWTEVVPDIQHPAETHTVDHPAVYETVEVTPAVPEVKEISHKEYQWKWWGYANHGQTTWTDGTYPTEKPNNWAGEWKKNGNERKVIDQAYVPGTPAVTEERVVTEAWTETVVDKEAWTEVVADIEHPAVECPPVVTYPPVITPATPSFTTAPTCDTDGTYVLPEGPAAQNHNPAAGLYGVELDGYHLYVRNTTGDFGGPGVYTWDAYGIGANGNAAYPKGTSVGGKVDGQGNPKAGGKVSGSFEVLPATGDCPVVVTPPNPQAGLTAVCGAAELTLTNPGATNQTASFIVNVDGEFYGAYAVVADGSEVVNFTFPEDSGTHNIQVFQAGISEWKEIANGDVPSDCELPPVTPEEPEEPTTPVTPVTPEKPAAAVVPMGGDDGLAETGLGWWIWLVAGGGAIALAAGIGGTVRGYRNN